MGKHFDKHGIHTHKKPRQKGGWWDFESQVGIREFTLFPPGNLLGGFNFTPILEASLESSPGLRKSRALMLLFIFLAMWEKYSQSQGRTQSLESCDDCHEQREGEVVIYCLLEKSERRDKKAHIGNHSRLPEPAYSGLEGRRRRQVDC